MAGMELTANEQRVLGCLIEKQRTTPDVYPLSTNAIRTACNQSTNRDPVLSLDDHEVREACHGLAHKRLARMTSRAGVRTIKYRHLVDETLNLSSGEIAIMAVLLLRGPQTVGELRTRTERLHAFPSTGQVSLTLEGLGAKGLTELREREPGRKEPRYAHLIGPATPAGLGLAGAAASPPPTAAAAPPASAVTAPPAPLGSPSSAPSPSISAPHVTPAPAPSASPAASTDPAVLDRIAALERRIAALERELGVEPS